MEDIRQPNEQRQAPEQPQRRRSGGASGGHSIFARPVFWIGLIVILAVLGGGYYLWQNPGVLGGANGGNTGSGGNSSDIVATVDGQDITRSQLNSRVEQTRNGQLAGQTLNADQEGQLRQQTLTTLINEALLMQKANEQNISVTDEELQQAFQQVRDRFDSDEAFQQELENSGLTESAFQERIERELLIQKVLQQNTNIQDITVSDQEVQQLYDQLSQQQDDVPSLEQVRQQLENQIRQQKSSQIIQQYVQQLRDEANIENSLTSGSQN